jgi:hypothetical protein
MCQPSASSAMDPNMIPAPTSASNHRQGDDDHRHGALLGAGVDGVAGVVPVRSRGARAEPANDHPARARRVPG